MDEYESLSHTKWECKYHVVFIPKYRRKALYGELRAHPGEVPHGPDRLVPGYKAVPHEDSFAK